MDRQSNYDDSGTEFDSQATSPSSPPNLPTPDSDAANDGPPSPAKGLRLYSQMIDEIAKVMGLHRVQPDTDDSFEFFGHLDKNQAPPLQLGFIPSLLKHAKAACNKLSSTPLMPRHINNLFIQASSAQLSYCGGYAKQG
ncbi:hypothetical protein JRQ81_000772 [Phrynocephalus forsythii]|uniref:Uncharacterized protein n=1 Tax=Phrynocephalus forsythii TaxID=171643 RepID=A0A9Q1B7P8_9SAUR|nr:hypothetical protein JRQ81_000772 [Phrynocephalus forsythii]